jgi:ADP-dependent NAD(P)H-hydrate dehydratase / NAD(P)H-hydrate epimerase
MSKNNQPADEIRSLFPPRPPESHKGDYGKVFIQAGSEGMLGAALLCSRGALRVGAGLVYLGVPPKARDIVNLATPEVITIGGDNAADYLSPVQKSDALAVGPGLGWRRALARELLFKLSEAGFSAPVVIDADGLNAFIGDLAGLKGLGLRLILTPHAGEMARLLDRKSDEIQKNRTKVAAETAKLLNCVVVLKGWQTVVADTDGTIYINNTGNPGMAGGGSGDVLTGMIAGLAAQGASPRAAAVAGVYLHGLAGDLAAKEKGEYGLIASDLVEKIPDAIQKFN